MNKTELLRVAEILETKVTDDQLNMEVFRCGTEACAIGWYCTHHDCDLKLENINGLAVEPVYRGFRGFSAIEVYFGIKRSESEFLFGADDTFCLSRVVIAERIKKFVETGHIKNEYEQD